VQQDIGLLRCSVAGLPLKSGAGNTAQSTAAFEQLFFVERVRGEVAFKIAEQKIKPIF
jgi:hypothetical protein